MSDTLSNIRKIISIANGDSSLFDSVYRTYNLKKFCRLNRIKISVNKSNIVTLYYEGNRIVTIEFDEYRSSRVRCYWWKYRNLSDHRDMMDGEWYGVRNNLMITDYDTVSDTIDDIAYILYDVFHYHRFENPMY